MEILGEREDRNMRVRELKQARGDNMKNEIVLYYGFEWLVKNKFNHCY